MQITKFINYLNLPDVNWIQNAPNEEEVYDFRPFSSEKLTTNILYIGYIERFPKVSTELPINFLCIRNPGKNHKFQDFEEHLPNANLIILETTMNYRKVCDLCSDIFIQESIHNQHVFHLLTEYSKNLGLSHLIDSAYSTLKSPIILADNSYRILGMYHGREVDGRHDLEAQREIGYLSADNINRLKNDRIYEQARELSAPFYSKSHDEKYAWITIMLQISGIEVASLSIMESDHPFTSRDMQYMKLFSDLVVLELQKTDSFSGNLILHKNTLLYELLEDKIHNEDDLKRRINQLNWTSRPFYNILTIIDKKHSLHSQLKLIIRHLSDIITFEYALHEERLILLIPQTVETAPVFRYEEKVLDFLKINNLTGIVSQRFSTLLHLKKYYYQTTELNSSLEDLHTKNALLYFDDHLFLHLRRLLTNNAQLEAYYHPLVIKMIAYDHLNNTQYAATLFTYLQNPDNPKQCADHLFIHKNTFYYRLNKIKELFPIDLSNGTERLRIHLTLTLMQFN